MKRVVGSALIVDRRGRILLGRRAGSGEYCPPGGKVEVGETIEQGTAREVFEEVNVRVHPKDMELLGFCDLRDKVIFFYLVLIWSGKIVNREPDKHRDWEWLADIPSDCVEGLSYFNRAFRDKMHARIKESI